MKHEDIVNSVDNPAEFGFAGSHLGEALDNFTTSSLHVGDRIGTRLPRNNRNAHGDNERECATEVGLLHRRHPDQSYARGNRKRE